VADRLPLRALAGGAGLALGSMAAAAAELHAEARQLDGRTVEMLALLALGALPAGLLAPIAARRFARSAAGRALWAGGLALFGGVCGQALGFGLHFYLNAYGEHDDIDSLAGILQITFTTAHGALYYVLFGLRLLWPWGLAGVAAVALAATIGPHASRRLRGAARTEVSAA
jgi:uncharacterized membrane protein YfcA